MISRLAEVRDDWRRGRGYGYPACCIAHYCWDILLGRPPTAARYAEILHDWSGPGSRWDWHPRPWDEMHQVPCGVLHAGGSPLPLRSRIWRIVAYSLPLLPSPFADLRLSGSQPPRVEWADDAAYDAWLTGVYLNRELEWS